MRRLAPLPPALVGMPFTTADARAAGVGNRRLQAPDVARPFHGVAVARPVDEGLMGRSEALGLRLLDGQVLSHSTALGLWGAPLPVAATRALHVSVAYPRTPPRTVGVTGHALRRIAPRMLLALPVSEPAAAWCEAAAVLSRDALIAAGDALVTGRRRNGVREPGLVTPADLAAALAVRFRAAGAARARRALGLVRVGVDSPKETALRLLLLAARLPEPAVDHPVPTVEQLFHADLAYPEPRVVLEYEGDEHRADRIRWMRDIRRRELMEDAGWRVVRVVAEDLDDPGPLIARIRRLLATRR